MVPETADNIREELEAEPEKAAAPVSGSVADEMANFVASQIQSDQPLPTIPSSISSAAVFASR